MMLLCCAGRLGRDAESTATPSGTSILKFSIAVDRGYGEKKHVCWINCALFGKRGDSLAPYLKKGTQVCVSGQADLREWTNGDGVPKTSLDIRVDEVTLMGSRADSSNQQTSLTPVNKAADRHRI